MFGTQAVTTHLVDIFGNPVFGLLGYSTLAGLPPAGLPGRQAFVKDTNTVYVDTGTLWKPGGSAATDLPAGTPGSGAVRVNSGYAASGLRFSATAYGVVGDNNNATAGPNTVNLNNCVAAAAAAGPGSIVEFDWLGTAYWNGGPLIYSRLIYEGRLFGGTLKLANGRPAGTHVAQTASFSTLTQTKAIAGAGEYEFFVDKLSLDGNKANNPTGGCGLALYGYGYWTGDMVIANCHSSGFWSEYFDQGEPINTLVGSTHQRGCHMGGKITLIDNDCAPLPALNTRLADGRGTLGGGQFTFYGPGDSEGNSFEIFRDSSPAGVGFLIGGIDFASGTSLPGFGFNVDKLVVWLNHDIGVQVDASIFFCNYLHSEGANTNLQLSNQEFHISQSQVFGPRAGGTNLKITGGGNFSYLQCTMQSVSSAGTMVNIANNTCRDATLLISCGEGNSYAYTLAAGTRPYASKICDVSLNNYGSGVVTAGWVPSSPDFPGDTFPGVNYKTHFLSGPIVLNGGVTIWSGDGVPPAGMGANGDEYKRRDTPGTANQRTYVKSGGAWTGVY